MIYFVIGSGDDRRAIKGDTSLTHALLMPADAEIDEGDSMGNNVVFTPAVTPRPLREQTYNLIQAVVPEILKETYRNKPI